jgi:tripartite-type tricarboxylate transporter receptor subunit TctC
VNAHRAARCVQQFAEDTLALVSIAVRPTGVQHRVYTFQEPSMTSPAALLRPIAALARPVAAGALIAASLTVAAFPTQPVRVVIGAAVGSAPDAVTRVLAESMAPSLGQPVIVENRPGAGGTLATAAVAAAAPDGHTLNVSGCSGDAITHAFVSQGRAPLTPFKDLTPVGRLLLDHWLVLVPVGSDVTSLTAFAQKARAAAVPLTYPSPGEGSTPHLQGERLARAMGFKALHVAYKDTAVNDLVGGRLDYAILPSASAMPLVKGGRLKALSVLSADRLAALPDVPTAEQAGLQGYTFNGGLCLWAPGATPPAALARLNRALVDAAGVPAVREKMQALGADPTPYDLDATARYVRDFVAESDRLRAAVFGSAR